LEKLNWKVQGSNNSVGLGVLKVPSVTEHDFWVPVTKLLILSR